MTPRLICPRGCGPLILYPDPSPALSPGTAAAAPTHYCGVTSCEARGWVDRGGIRVTRTAGEMCREIQRRRCEAGHHLPLINRARYDAAGPEWAGIGDCPACRGTVKRPLEVQNPRQDAA